MEGQESAGQSSGQPGISGRTDTLGGEGSDSSLAVCPRASKWLYLAGPYHGSAISLVSGPKERFGPYDMGTVGVTSCLADSIISRGPRRRVVGDCCCS